MKTVDWERKPLGSVADLCLGKMLDQNKNRGEPFPYLANVNVRWGEFELSDLRTMRFEPKEMDRYGLKFGDIVMCEGGKPGRCAIWKDQVPGMMIQKALHRIRPKEFLDYRFLFYSFLHLGYSKVFDQYFTGATIKHLPGEKLAKVEVDIPPLPVQQRIAGILSAYDELIENSQRRIKILEAMARALYREWFVHFRFPGHENHPRVASPLGEIPQGWEVKKLGEIISAHIGGGWGKEVEDEDHTEPAWVIRGTDIPEARYSQVAGVPYRTHTASNLRSRKLVAGDIVFEVSGGSKGQPVGRTLLITPELLASLGGDVICASFCKRIQPDVEGYGSELLYERDVDDLKPFQLRRWVRLDEGAPISIIVDLMMPDDAKTQKNRPPLVDGLRVIEASGGRVALDHNVVHHIEGRMPDGRNNAVDLLVASIPAFLVMKGYALIGRDKKKDAYDIYFSVRNFDGGPVALAEACKELLTDESVTMGYRNIAGKFRHEDDFGPQTVKAFLAESDALGEMTPEQIQVDAFMQVRAWLRKLGLMIEKT